MCSERIGAVALPVDSSLASSMSVHLTKTEVKVNLNSKLAPSNEAYQLSVDTAKQQVHVCASEAAGAFWGVQTLLSLVHGGSLPAVEIKDAPRYPYRGMHLDVSRNFHSKESVLRLLEVMGMYKLNKFHFHLTDDEGWRLQIPGLEELTEVSAFRFVCVCVCACACVRVCACICTCKDACLFVHTCM